MARHPDAPAALLIRLVRADPELESTLTGGPGGWRGMPLDTLAHRLGAREFAYRAIEATARLAFHALAGSPRRAEALFEHALAAAIIAEILGERMGRPPATCRICGLLHHLGVALLAASDPPLYWRCADELAGTDTPLVEMERQAFGLTHLDAAALVLPGRGFPEPVLEAAAHAHDPGREASFYRRLAWASCTLAHQLGFDMDLRNSPPPLDPSLADFALLADEELPRLCAELGAHVKSRLAPPA